ncbi:MAG TPA: flagellar brake protein, partial [Lachnospiraceae bacterium]|nr:flagellar brake protein [Lachnospiraceae bacterium]
HLPGVYEYRVEFKNIRKRDREDLIKYIFEQERRRRKNEKG